MNDKEIKTLDQARRFVDGTADIEFAIETKRERYEWIEETFERFVYANLPKKDKGVLLSFAEKVTGYSRVQVKRLAARYAATGGVRLRTIRNRGFRRKYTDRDIGLLAETDELHETLSGPATKKICERAFEVFGKQEYCRLAGISVAHLYNLRQSRKYRNERVHFTKTRPAKTAIGQRRRPRPEGRPGFIRVDTVHQGDLDGIKGVYHINAVDEVTQFEIVCSVQRISENFLVPVLEELIEAFPFNVRGFHSDNGSEFINYRVTKMLNDLLIDLTKSRARHSNDNALAESKNGSVVRKHLGYVHLPQEHAPLINRFLREHLNPYVNYHRPCFFPVVVTSDKGKQEKRYPYNSMMTPYEKLRSLPDADRYLKSGTSFQKLDQLAYTISDNEAARRLKKAKNRLFDTIDKREKRKRRSSSVRTATP